MLPVITFQLFPTTYSSWQFKRYAWPKRENVTSEYEMDFSITNVEILKRRSKPKAPCSEDWNIHGQNIEAIFQNLMEEVGCRAPYQQSHKPLPLCHTKEKMMKMVSSLLADPTKNYPPACDTLENLQYTYSEQDFKQYDMGPEWFWICLDMPDRFKEIIQTRAVDFHTLVGNCGGYIGLFLGKCFAPCTMIILQRQTM